MFLNKNDMIDLLNHLITTGRFWHLEYARQNVVNDEFQRIKKERDKFDKDLLKKGIDIINDLESNGNVKSITIFTEGQSLIFTNEEYSSRQLEQIRDCLKTSKNIDIQNSNKCLFINRQNICGYEISYETQYNSIFTRVNSK